MGAGSIAAKVLEFFKPPRLHDVVKNLELETMENYQVVHDRFQEATSWGMRASWTFVAIALTFAISIPWVLAHAGDAKEKVAETISEVKGQMSSLESRMSKIEGQNSAMQAALNELVAQKVATDICRTVKRLRAESDPLERNALREELDSSQRRYAFLSDGKDYPEDRCQ